MKDIELNIEKIKCLNCENELEADNRLSLQIIKCPNCDREFTVWALPDGSRTEFYEIGN